MGIHSPRLDLQADTACGDRGASVNEGTRSPVARVSTSDRTRAAHSAAARVYGSMTMLTSAAAADPFSRARLQRRRTPRCARKRCAEPLIGILALDQGAARDATS